MFTPADRIQMLDIIQVGGKDCIEIGVHDGGFSGEILARNPNKHFMVDPWIHQDPKIYPDDRSNFQNPAFEDLYQTVLAKYGNDKRAIIVRDVSYNFVKQIPYDSMDFIYVDAIHTFESCFCDMMIWFQKLKTGGWMCVDDYGTKYLGVKYAVDAFTKLTGQKISLITREKVWVTCGIRKE